ncbi:MAG: hypothetical protein QOJ19_3369 [Acidimicrobiia bacterium]|jgi:hypothetical protein|nr:hypothetical protein [Acidimicrobiia bacterium]
MSTNGVLDPYRNGFDSAQNPVSGPRSWSVAGSSASVGTLRALVDRASRELFSLWRSAVADNDLELTNRLIVAGHALQRATAALDQAAVLPDASRWPWS